MILPVRDRPLLDQVDDVVRKVAGLFRAHGFEMLGRGLADVLGLRRVGDTNRLGVGGGMEWADVEIFARLARLPGYAPRTVHAIGNAFGFSTLCLSQFFPSAGIDVIDAGVEGANNREGIQLTRKIAESISANVSVYLGRSPQQTRKSTRVSGYQLMFIDGMHNPTQIEADFFGELPYLRLPGNYHDA
jgi:hypothetical protein